MADPTSVAAAKRIAITGASGLLGDALTASLVADGHTVLPLVRDHSRASGGAIYWSVRQRAIEAEKLEGLDAVVHLAGEPIASGRWNPEVKRRILESRVQGTTLLTEALAGLTDKPPVLVSASAVGFYGDRGSEILTEGSAAGSGFLPDLVIAWEAAAEPARAAGIRVVHPRTGIVLTAKGGALKKMLLPFKLGVGGRIGSGQQYMSWISLQDWVGGVRHLIDGDLDGPVNLTGPNPVDNIHFTKALGDVLGRPTVFPVPAFAIKAALGEMGERLTLDSQNIVPARLVDSGFAFQHSNVRDALAWAVAN